MSRQAFDEFVYQADSAMVLVTLAQGADMYGCLVGFHTQTSIEPIRYLVCLSAKNATCRAANSVNHLGVHLLGSDNHDLALLFGGVTADDGINKFEQCEWQCKEQGPPIIKAAPAWFIGRIVGRHELGDHIGFLLEPSAAEVKSTVAPLRFHDVSNIDAGH